MFRVDPSGDVRDEADLLLARRQDPQWVSLSWVALRPLISSLNEVLCAGAPSLVPRLRNHWLGQVPATGDNLALSRHLDRSGDSAFVVIGDTGEQDRSQYIVPPVLRRVVGTAGRGQAAPGFAVVCSDVLYPSGDVNGYVHGLYLPYGPDPGAPDHAGGTTPTRLERLPLLAIPGNHDWHDGLAGFMQHFCGTGGLDRGLVGWPDVPPGPHTPAPTGLARWQDGLVRLLWRRPVAARPQRFWRRLPGESSPLPPLGDGLPADAPRDVAAQRTLRGPATGQPGSYFTVQVDGLLVVAIDTGVGLGDGDSMVDAEQARWLVAVSRRPGPKVLLTGNPLLVNAQWKVCRLGDPDDEPLEGYSTVNELVADPALGYVAAVGGDIHNFQHYPQVVGPDGGHLVHYVVSGGGGAYMSATHPIEVVANRAADASRRDTDVVVEANRLTGGAAVRTAGSGTAVPNDVRLVEGPMRLIPTPPESLAHFARLVLPKLWRLERALLAGLAGMAAGQALHLADAGRAGRDLLVGSGVLALLLVARTLVSKPLTRRLFRDRDVERAPLTRAYRAAIALTAAVAGVDLTLAGAWAAGPAWTRHLVAWTALTSAAAVTAAILRYTGWWRDPVPRDADTAVRRTAVATGVWVGCLLVALWLGQLLPAGPRQWVPATVVAAVGFLGRLLAWRYRPTAATVRGVWGRRAPAGSYLIQAVATLAVLTGAVFDRGWWVPAATVLGVPALGAVLVASFAVAAGVVRATATLTTPWQAGWGRAGGTAPWLTGLVATGVLVGQLVLALRPASGPGVTAARVLLGVLWALPLGAAAAVALAARARALGWSLLVLVGLVAVLIWRLGVPTGPGAGFAGGSGTWFAGGRAALVGAYRQTLATELALGALLAVLLVIDTLRRRTRGLRFTVPAIAVAFAPVLLTWTLDVRTAWTLRAAIVPVAGALLVGVAVVLAHLVFLGAQYLVLDRDAHRDRPDLLTLPEARTFLDWRATEQGTPPLSGRTMRRARTVFPTTDSPRGPIQEKVSEIFDSDVPPFWKNFLVLRIEPGSGAGAAQGQGTSGRRLRIDVHVVRGLESVEVEAVPVEPAILVDLPD